MAPPDARQAAAQAPPPTASDWASPSMATKPAPQHTHSPRDACDHGASSPRRTAKSPSTRCRSHGASCRGRRGGGQADRRFPARRRQIFSEPGRTRDPSHPGFAVIRLRIDRNKCASDAELIGLAAKRHPVSRIAGLQFADRTNRHDDAVLVRLAKHIDGVDVGNLLEQFGLGIRPDALHPGRSDLEVEVA